MRKIERYLDNDWHACRMSELNIGDIFRIEEEAGSPVSSSICDNFITLSVPTKVPNMDNSGYVCSVHAKTYRNDDDNGNPRN